MLNAILNFFMLRSLRIRSVRKRFLNSIASEVTEEFLELLLRFMGLVLLVNRDFRKNIEGFNGRYLFRSADGGITVAAVFRNGRLKVREEEIDDTDITVTFRNARALVDYLLSPKPDIIGSLLKQDVVLDGNLNYLYKFAYMANHLRLLATGGV